MIDWADVLFVMERRHLDMIKQRFELSHQAVVVLDIADNYQFADAELIAMLTVSLAGYL